MAKLPKAVQDQVDRANKMADEMFKKEAPVQEPATPDPNTPPVETPPVETPPVEPDPTAPPAEEPPAPVEPAPANPDEDTFKHKYEVLKGKYSAEMKAANARIANLETLMAQMTAQPPAQPAAPATPQVPETDEELEAFKSDYPGVYSAMQKLLAKKGTAPEVVEKVNTLEKKVEDESLMRFYGILEANVEDWRTVNNDPAFIGWLANKLPYSSATKHDALMQAFNQKDVSTVIEVFNDYKAITRPAASAPKPKPPTDPTKYVAPPSGGSRTDGQAPAGKQVYRRDEVEQFYKNLALGKLKSWTRAQITARETEYLKAAQEGRMI